MPSLESIESSCSSHTDLRGTSQDFLTVATVDSFSFPSGHTSRASMVAGLAAASLLPEHPEAVAAAASWAVIVAASRVVLGRHYATDVIGGLVLGAAVTWIATNGTWSDGGFHVGAEDIATIQIKAAEVLSSLRPGRR